MLLVVLSIGVSAQAQRLCADSYVFLSTLALADHIATATQDSTEKAVLASCKIDQRKVLNNPNPELLNTDHETYENFKVRLDCSGQTRIAKVGMRALANGLCEFV